MFMDDQTTIKQLKDIVQNFSEERDWDQFHNPKDLAIGLITEASELLEHFRFKSPDQISEMMQNDEKRQEISDELADSLMFVLRFAQKNNFDLTTALNKKMEKNVERYPAHKVKGQNKKYNEY